MTTLRTRIQNFIVPNYGEAIAHAYELGQHVKTQQEAAKDIFNQLVKPSDYRLMRDTYTQAKRKEEIENSYQLFYSNTTAHGLIGRTLDYGLGKRVFVKSDSGQDVIDEVVGAIRNTAVLGVRNFRHIGFDFLHQMELLYVVWYDEATKLSTVTRLPTTSMEIVWADPLTMIIPSLFIFTTDEGKIVYRSWTTMDEALNTYLSENDDAIYADNMKSNTMGLSHVAVWAVGHIRHYTSGRGVPYLSVVSKLSQYLAQFEDQRAAISAKAAMYTDEYDVDGTSFDLQDFINRETRAGNPAYGSSFVGNDGVEHEWANNHTNTQQERFLQHVCLQGVTAATGANHAFLGVPSALSNRSVLDKLMEVFVEYIESFQNTVSDTIRELFTVILLVSSGAPFGDPTLLEVERDATIVVTLDTPININVPDAMQFVAAMRARESLTPEEEARVVELEKIIFQKFGVVN